METLIWLPPEIVAQAKEPHLIMTAVVFTRPAHAIWRQNFVVRLLEADLQW